MTEAEALAEIVRLLDFLTNIIAIFGAIALIGMFGGLFR